MRMSRKSGVFFMWRSPGLKTSSIFFTPPSGQTVTPSSGYSVLPGFWERSRVSFSRSGGVGVVGGWGGGGGGGAARRGGQQRGAGQDICAQRFSKRYGVAASGVSL